MTEPAKYLPLAEQIATRLGAKIDESQLHEDISRFAIKLPSIHPEAEIQLTFDAWRSSGRVKVIRRYPRGADGYAGYPRSCLTADQIGDLNTTSEITADHSRPADKIAADISRKLLKDFGELLTKMAAARAEREDREARNDRIFADMCNLAGVTRHLDVPPHRRRDDRSFHQYNSGASSIKCDVRYDGKVMLELSHLKPGLAAQLIKLVRASIVEQQ
ncbi:hypothetical protein [Achromobacter sp. AGC39]